MAQVDKIRSYKTARRSSLRRDSPIALSHLSVRLVNIKGNSSGIVEVEAGRMTDITGCCVRAVSRFLVLALDRCRKFYHLPVLEREQPRVVRHRLLKSAWYLLCPLRPMILYDCDGLETNLQGTCQVCSIPRTARSGEGSHSLASVHDTWTSTMLTEIFVDNRQHGRKRAPSLGHSAGFTSRKVTRKSDRRKLRKELARVERLEIHKGTMMLDRGNRFTEDLSSSKGHAPRMLVQRRLRG